MLAGAVRLFAEGVRRGRIPLCIKGDSSCRRCNGCSGYRGRYHSALVNAWGQEDGQRTD